jgi:hypothetical protein
LEPNEEVRVHVSLKNIARSSSGAVTGPIWLATDEPGNAFPEVEWSDSPIILLANWIPAVRRLFARGEAAECHFLEGPYRFTVGAASAGIWRVTCFETLETPSATNAVAEWGATPDGFLESAISAARMLLGYCDSRSLWNDDTERLRKALEFSDPERGH